ncbi:MAG: MaoC family dehydratase [Chloroflexota bacterium]|nr:MaoC family dehydratase [Chloroflexota bacterium]
MRYFEDFSPGETIRLGLVEVSEVEILEFARRYDPQPFHIDAEWARQSSYGGLIASGWHTAALCMRLLVDGVLADSAGMGSPGVDELRWLRPVRPGDVLTGRFTVLECVPSRNKPDRGVVRFRAELDNQHGETVLRFEAIGLMGRRP